MIMKSRKMGLFLILLWLIAAGLIVWFKVLPFGQASYSLKYPIKQNLLGGKGFIGHLTPAERVDIKDDSGAKIFGDPVYFSVFTPRTFNEAKITFIYEDYLSSSTPVIEAGVLVDNVIWRYQLNSLENKKIASFSNWHVISDGNLTLFQRERIFNKLADFLTTLKNNPNNLCQNSLRECLAFYNIKNTDTYLPIENFSGRNKAFKEINIPLQGAHQFYFIKPEGKNFSFSFDFADLNLNKDADHVEISIYKDSDKVYSKKIIDDFGAEESALVRNFSTKFSWSLEDSDSYLYLLEIKVNDDVVIKKIKEAPGALNVVNRVRPLKIGAIPLTFYTDSNFIQASANDPANLQDINFGTKEFSLSEPYKQFEFLNKENGIKEINLEKGDIILETDGIFSFDSNSFFNYKFTNIDRHFILDGDLQFLLTTSSDNLVLEDGLKQASVVLNTKDAYRERGKYSFILSTPGLSLSKDGYLIIKEIKVEFRGRTLFDKLKDFFSLYDD